MCDSGHPVHGIDLKEWPRPSEATLKSGITDIAGEFLTEVRCYPEGTIWIPDVRKLGLTDKRTIVSRKRTRNMFDFTSLWKKEVFSKLDEVILAERDLDVPGPSAPEPVSHTTTSSSSPPPVAGNAVTDDTEEDVIYANFDPSGRRSPGLGRGLFG